MYVLPQPEPLQQRLAGAWIGLGVVALALGGLFAILLVLARTPGIGPWLPVADFFRVALIVHVDLTVLVWFSGMAAAFWCLNSSAKGISFSWFGFALCLIGICLMSISAFWQPGSPIMSNYIPVLDNNLFIAGLSLFGLGITIHLARSLLSLTAWQNLTAAAKSLRQASFCSLIAALIAIIAFAWSFIELPANFDSSAYYEILFWGGGHALQFVWVLLVVAGWLWLAGACGFKFQIPTRSLFALMLLTVAGALVTLYAYLVYGVLSPTSYLLQTQAMRWLGGIVAVPVMLYVVWAFVTQKPNLLEAQKPLRNALATSILLFASGGAIALFIQGSDVRIPAHYHGSIVGVTLAFMGLVYSLLPSFAWRAPQGRLAKYQPWIYGIGQLLHVFGLAWSGGYGVQRKVAGSEQILYTKAEVIGMGMMGLGGLLAVIGGALFVVVVYLSRPQHKHNYA